MWDPNPVLCPHCWKLCSQAQNVSIHFFFYFFLRYTRLRNDTSSILLLYFPDSADVYANRIKGALYLLNSRTLMLTCLRDWRFVPKFMLYLCKTQHEDKVHIDCGLSRDGLTYAIEYLLFNGFTATDLCARAGAKIVCGLCFQFQ